MTFAIAGTSGRTGHIIAEALLAAGKKVRVIVRDADKGEAWVRRGAEVAVADLADAPRLKKALQGATGAYLLVPPSFTDAYRAQQDTVSRALAAALTETPVAHVVLLSSIGAQHARGTGPIAGLHLTEALLSKIPGVTLTALRAAYFIENIAASVSTVRENGILPSFFPAELRFAMTNTVDIGKVATRLLLEPSTRSRVVELGTERSFDDLARALSRITGKQVTVQEAPLSAMVQTLTGFGFPRGLAELYEEMTGAIRSGHVRFDGHERVEDAEPLERTLNRLLAG